MNPPSPSLHHSTAGYLTWRFCLFSGSTADQTRVGTVQKPEQAKKQKAGHCVREPTCCGCEGVSGGTGGDRGQDRLGRGRWAVSLHYKGKQYSKVPS